MDNKNVHEQIATHGQVADVNAVAGINAVADINVIDEPIVAAQAQIPSPWRLMWREIYSDKIALVALFLFVGIMLATFIWAATMDSAVITRVYLLNRNEPPSAEFWLGRDMMGRDTFSMFIVGARNSFLIALTIAFAFSIIGILVGLFAGFYGGHIDNVVMRILDFFTMIPTLMVIIVLVTLLPSTVMNFALILIIFAWIGMARLIRMVTLRQGAMDYVKASKTLGTRNIVIIFREVLPNIVSFMVVNLTIGIASTMGIETGLTFLGFGLPPTTPSLGTQIANAQNFFVLRDRPEQWLPAALLVLLMMLCINYVGQALNRAADARRRRV